MSASPAQAPLEAARPSDVAIDVGAASRQLRDHCYTVLPALYDEARIQALREGLLGIHERLGRPALQRSEGLEWLAENVERSSTGLVVHKLLGFLPDAHRGILRAEAAEIVRAVLGADMHLEMVAAVLSDHHRPFFPWHMHVGGIDDEAYRRRGARPTYDTHQRIAMLVYLDPMTEGSGQLVVHPRRVHDPIEPPHPITERHWPGEVPITGPAGTAVLLEQSTWHAVLPREPADEPRMFVGLWFAAAHASEAEREDESLGELIGPDEVMASVLRHRPRGAAP